MTARQPSVPKEIRIAESSMEGQPFDAMGDEVILAEGGGGQTREPPASSPLRGTSRISTEHPSALAYFLSVVTDGEWAQAAAT
jgi:hypothetical protein